MELVILVLLAMWFLGKVFGSSRTHWTEEQDPPPEPEVKRHDVPRKGWW